MLWGRYSWYSQLFSLNSQVLEGKRHHFLAICQCRQFCRSMDITMTWHAYPKLVVYIQTSWCNTIFPSPNYWQWGVSPIQFWMIRTALRKVFQAPYHPEAEVWKRRWWADGLMGGWFSTKGFNQQTWGFREQELGFNQHLANQQYRFEQKKWWFNQKKTGAYRTNMVQVGVCPADHWFLFFIVGAVYCPVFKK